MTTTTKALETVTSPALSAGLLVSITQNTEFQVLVVVALIVSTLSWFHDMFKDERRSAIYNFAVWTRYVITGEAMMFVVFYSLVLAGHNCTYVRDMPPTVWMMTAMLAAGYATKIVSWLGDFIPTIFEKARDKGLR